MTPEMFQALQMQMQFAPGGMMLQYPLGQVGGATHSRSVYGGSPTVALTPGALYAGGGFGGSNVMFGNDPSLFRATQPLANVDGAPGIGSILPTHGRTPMSSTASSYGSSTGANSSGLDVDAALKRTRTAVQQSTRHPATGLGDNPVGSRLPPSNNPPGMM